MYAPACVLIKEFVKIFVHVEIRQMPIIEPRALQRLVAYIEAYRLYQMHVATRCRRRAHNIARVLRDFRLNQYYIKRHSSLPFRYTHHITFTRTFQVVCADCFFRFVIKSFFAIYLSQLHFGIFFSVWKKLDALSDVLFFLVLSYKII